MDYYNFDLEVMADLMADYFKADHQKDHQDQD